MVWPRRIAKEMEREGTLTKIKKGFSCSKLLCIYRSPLAVQKEQESQGTLAIS